jgi:hypothetical protein
MFTKFSFNFEFEKDISLFGKAECPEVEVTKNLNS